MRIRPAVALFLLSAACSDPAATADPQLIIEPAGAERTLRIGTHEQLRARVIGSDNSEIRWTTSDPAIARIDAGGMLRLASSYTACSWVTPGECQVRITAIAGDLRADQTLIVMPFEPTLELTASHLDLEMGGDSARITARVLLENNPVPWCTMHYRSQDSSIARVNATSGFVSGNDEGSTAIEVHSSGVLCPRDAGRVTVTNRPPIYVLNITPDVEVALAPGSSVQLVAEVTNRKGVVYPALSVSWSSSDPDIFSVENGLVRAGSCTSTSCSAVITARSGRLVATTTLSIRPPL